MIQRQFHRSILAIRHLSLMTGIVLLAASTSLVAQDDEGTIFFDALPFASNGVMGDRIDLLAAIPYTRLDFRKGSDGFEASYRITMSLVRGEEVVFDTTWTRHIATAEFGRTDGTIAAYEFFQQRVPIAPGDYSARLEIVDYATNLATRSRRNVSVIDFQRYPFALSGLMAVSRIREKESGYGITPLLTNNFSLAGDHYFLFFEAYNRTGSDSFQVHARYLDESGEEVWQSDWRKEFPAGTSQQWIRLPVDGFGSGKFTVEVTAFGADSPVDTLAAARRVVWFRGSSAGMPLSEEEVIDKVKKLRYVATQSEMSYISDGATFIEKRKRFAEFWENLDPTPSTPENEAMDEYFRRIDYADRTFRSYAEGWLTDMGRIYIVFGPPDRIERDPFAGDGKPRQTWEYYGQRRNIEFVDQTGFGDFRLLTPVPLSEKYHF